MSDPSIKRTAYFVFFLLVLSICCGILLSDISVVGKVGIKFFYKEYTFLKTWYKGASVVFIVLVLLFVIQLIVLRIAKRTTSHIINVACIIGALVGLYFTYYDFRHTTTHRWLGERFHLGGYLFWIGWMIVSIYMLLQKKPLSVPADLEKAPGQTAHEIT